MDARIRSGLFCVLVHRHGSERASFKLQDFMAEHYPEGTLETTAWCGTCGRHTQHRVDFPPAGQKGGGRKGPCLEHEAQPETKKQTAARERREKEARNPRLFE
jgi:hypothetical protein